MKKKIIYFCACLALASAALPAFAQTTTASSGTGVLQLTLAPNQANWCSLPLTGQAIYTGMVSTVTSNKISVSSTSTNFTTSLPDSGTTTPYFVQFLTGNEAGRTLLVKSDTATSLTLDTTDNGIGSTVALNASGYKVAAGDKFQIFPGDTLASVFGDGSKASPLLLTAANNPGSADQVTLCGSALKYYFFNKSAGYWQCEGSSTNANNTVIYPYSAICVNRTSGSAITLLLTGGVTPVNACEKVAANTNVYGSSHYATGITLAKLNLGSTWVKSTNASKADNIGIWSASANAFNFYYQQPNGNWYQCYTTSTAVQNSLAIPAGAATVLYKRESVSGSTAFVVSAMPYSTTAE